MPIRCAYLTPFQSSFGHPDFNVAEITGILTKKREIMKIYIKRKEKEEETKMNLWDAFTNHLDSIYFPGATDSLDKKTLAFEYENFKACYIH